MDRVGVVLTARQQVCSLKHQQCMIYLLCTVEVETVAVPGVCLQFTLLKLVCDWCAESGVTLAVHLQYTCSTLAVHL